MRFILFIILMCIAASLCGQDSVALKILHKPLKVKDTTYYTVMINFIDRKEKVIVKCYCKEPIRKKGEIVMVAKKDLIFD